MTHIKHILGFQPISQSEGWAVARVRLADPEDLGSDMLHDSLPFLGWQTTRHVFSDGSTLEDEIEPVFWMSDTGAALALDDFNQDYQKLCVVAPGETPNWKSMERQVRWSAKRAHEISARKQASA
jgi:hypothetical protein